MDGLMLDTEPLYRRAWQRACEELGFCMSDDQYLRYIGRRTDEAEVFLVEDYGHEFPLDHFRTVRRKHELDIFNASPLQRKPGIEEVLTVVESNELPKAVATMTSRQKAIGRLTAASLLERFDVIAAGDEVTAGKPEPDLFLLAAERLGVSPANCLVLEDAEPGILGAHRAGMQVFMVPDLNRPSDAVIQLLHGKFDSLHGVAEHLKAALAKGRNSHQSRDIRGAGRNVP